MFIWKPYTIINETHATLTDIYSFVTIWNAFKTVA